MSQRTKKQHYVPQCYLNAWSTSKHQIYVFDKSTESARINSIQDVASERFFYDINPEDYLSPDFLNALRQRGVSLDDVALSQVLERTFAKNVEKPFSDLLKEILDKTAAATPWHINNCYFISEEKKVEFSVFLALQFIRTKKTRTNIHGSSECLRQVLTDMGVPDSEIAKNTISKEDAKRIHLEMIVDENYLAEMTGCFHNLTWMLAVNRTGSKLYTSDSPIATFAHINHPFMPMNGLASKGVEVFFPLSPNVILLMVDGSYHKRWLPFERRYIELTDNENIDFYNSVLALQAERFIFSSDGNMTVLDRMKEKDQNVFKQPQVQMNWGGKTYYPLNK